MIPYKQLSLADIFQDCQNKFNNDKPAFLSLLETHIDIDAVSYTHLPFALMFSPSAISENTPTQVSSSSLHTRTSTVYPLSAFRYLACVKPVASVHPEPGSNSPL